MAVLAAAVAPAAVLAKVWRVRRTENVVLVNVTANAAQMPGVILVALSIVAANPIVLQLRGRAVDLQVSHVSQLVTVVVASFVWVEIVISIYHRE